MTISTPGVEDLIPQRLLDIPVSIPVNVPAGSILVYDATTNKWIVDSTINFANINHERLPGRGAPNQHPVSAIAGLEGILNNKANLCHTHDIGDINDLARRLNLLIKAITEQNLVDHTDVPVQKCSLRNRDLLLYDKASCSWLNFNLDDYILSLVINGDNLGNHIATQDLEMSGFEVKDILDGTTISSAASVGQLNNQLISAHPDVMISAISNEDILLWDNISNVWKNVNLTTFVQNLINGFLITENLNMQNYRIINMADPVDGYDGATKDYVDILYNQLLALIQSLTNFFPSNPQVGDTVLYDGSSWVNRKYQRLRDVLSGADIIAGSGIVSLPTITATPHEYQLDVYINGVKYFEDVTDHYTVHADEDKIIFSPFISSNIHSTAIIVVEKKGLFL